MKVFILWLLRWFHLLVTYKLAIIAIGRQAMPEGTATNIISFPAHKHLKWLRKLPQYFSICDKWRKKPFNVRFLCYVWIKMITDTEVRKCSSGKSPDFVAAKNSWPTFSSCFALLVPTATQELYRDSQG